MQTKRERAQPKLTLLPPLETLIPEDHALRRLNRVLDLGFVHEMVRERCCQENGRPSVDPEVIIRLFLIQALSGIAHVRELMREVHQCRHLPTIKWWAIGPACWWVMGLACSTIIGIFSYVKSNLLPGLR